MTTIEFNCQFNILQHKLLPFAYRLTNNVEDAKDLIQETAMRAYNNKEKFESGTNFKAWVTTIMRNTFINIYRKKKNRATSSEPSDSYIFVNDKFAVDNNAPSNMTMVELDGIMHTLDNIYRTPFQLFFEGYKYEEIAENMNLPIGTVKSRIFFARQKLKETINFSYAYDTTMLN
ncbi:MAG: sigma-70 family RNA polymerase sigma factor [Saprospiraceae bacterium]|nr:sigma-70 family RNA polymerase sigma factor [Saprospiraceae bacterium]MCF8252106.1 sigma-70 family RNA polymerase sigma factor [Saprospiraceae bacterium]MCF8282463.1 sigma-70 family RNA polymerase sigma factor [Bacteroidales bacterium]MCF8313749.1 sigma-70 family RNA polymerase sigma factor [Saprospiraceae bacterium]MCF8442444.1 sigma-70 family RNA polymerase sigma factor [Saprospiraceae bacterium]